MPLLLSALLIAIPTWFYARWVRGVDRFEKEPAKYLIAAFLWGALPAAFLALISQLILSVPTAALAGEEGTNLITVVIYAPITEELFKGLAVAIIFLWRKREFDGWIDGIVYGSTVGFGFAFIENVLYLSQTVTLGEWFQLFFLRVIVLGFMHGFYTSFIGIGYGLARDARTTSRKLLLILGGFALAILVHAIHNGTIVLMDTVGAGSLLGTMLNYLVLIVLMIGLKRVGVRHERRLFRTYLVDEVPNVISQPAYDALALGKPASVPAAQPRAFYQLAGELAQRKMQLIRYGETTHAAEIDTLRAGLLQMRV
jgi:RsiW-degrading membrane proteinase PrsW (M82 family)